MNQFNSQITGRVFTANDPGYEEARLGWNRRLQQRPALIVEAKSASDVQTAVNYGRENNLGVAVQATGHGNIRPADDCLLILTREMNKVAIDPQAQTARLEAGLKWGPVLEAAQQHGLAPLLGSSPTVGAVGYTLGGGLGWLSRKYGLAADNVVQFEVVTGDGQLRIASAEENSDLFWGLRGGGGSLGIVTSMTIHLFPVTQVYAGNLFYPAEMAGEVFRRYRNWLTDVPDELTSSVLVMNFPPFPELPPFLRGQTFAIVRGCYCGPTSEGEALLSYWREWHSPLVDDFKEIPFSEAATISSDPEDPLPALITGAWLRELSDNAIDAVVSYAEGTVIPDLKGPKPLMLAEVRHAGGAIKHVSAASAVYGNRDAELILNMVGVIPTPEAQQQLEAYTGKLKEALQPDLTGGVYMNFLEGLEAQQRLGDGLASGGYQRLARLKAQFDPHNLLRHSFNFTQD
jgi:hypothetical protein